MRHKKNKKLKNFHTNKDSFEDSYDIVTLRRKIKNNIKNKYNKK